MLGPPLVQSVVVGDLSAASVCIYTRLDWRLHDGGLMISCFSVVFRFRSDFVRSSSGRGQSLIKTTAFQASPGPVISRIVQNPLVC